MCAQWKGPGASAENSCTLFHFTVVVVVVVVVVVAVVVVLLQMLINWSTL